jgi:hypothetical protein
MKHVLFDESKNMFHASSPTSFGEFLSTPVVGIFIASIVFGSIGTSYYISEKHNQSIYKPIICFIHSYSLVESQCPTQNCSGEFIPSCTTIYYTCHLDTYVVIYNVSDGRQIQSTSTAKDGPGPKSVRI